MNLTLKVAAVEGEGGAEHTDHEDAARIIKWDRGRGE